MTDRERVLSVYPDAVCYLNAYDGLFCVQKRIIGGGRLVDPKNNYSEIFKTPEDAWQNAWMKIQKTMLEKLES